MKELPATRERLISSACVLFHARSYGTVGVQELCEHADVRRGSFYYYFRSKEALALAVLDREQRDLTEEVFEPSFKNGGAPLDRFQRFLERLHRYHVRRIEREDGDVGGCPIANLGQELGSESELIRQKAAAILEGFTAAYVEAIEEAMAHGELPSDVNPHMTAERVRAYVQGLLETAKLECDPDVLPRLGIDVHGLAVRGDAGSRVNASADRADCGFGHSPSLKR